MNHAFRQVLCAPLIHPAAGKKRKPDHFVSILRTLLTQRRQASQKRQSRPNPQTMMILAMFFKKKKKKNDRLL